MSFFTRISNKKSGLPSSEQKKFDEIFSSYKGGKIALLLFPFDSGSVFAIGEKIARILSEILDSILVISSGIPESFLRLDAGITSIDLGYSRIRMDEGNNSPILGALQWIKQNLVIQIHMGIHIFKQRANITTIFCAVGGYYQFPILVGKLLRKKVIVFVGGESSLIAQVLYGSFLSRILQLGNRFNYFFADLILVESDALITAEVFQGFRSKIRNGALYFGEIDHFSTQVPSAARGDSIGYIGRLSPEKGIQEFTAAIPKIIAANPRIKIFIIGSGPLDEQIDGAVEKFDGSNVIRLPWVNKNEIPGYLNQIKLVVLPSKIEGLPNILLEAISCGTAILSTRVGGIPDVIIEGRTGFFLDSLDANHIAEKITTVLKDGSVLSEITSEANNLIRSKYSFTASVERYTRILRELDY